MTKILAMLAVPALLVLVLAAPPTSADAQDRPATAQARRAARRPRVIVLDQEDIYGQVQRPVFYVIPRTRPAPEERNLRTGMLREVVRTVQRAPF